MEKRDPNKEYGLLIDYEYCTGCHTCEMACKVEHQLPLGQWGIKLAQIGPFEIAPSKWDFHYVPMPTALCDLCAERVEEGRWPTCVHHCQSQVMEYGPIEEARRPHEQAVHGAVQALSPTPASFSPRGVRFFGPRAPLQEGTRTAHVFQTSRSHGAPGVP